MMLQPRAFLYTHPSAVTPRGPKPERVVEKRANRMSAKLEYKDMASTSRPAKPTSDARLVTPLPSLPVIIPTRGSYQDTVHDRRKSQGRKERPGPWNKDSDRARSRQIHSSDALPPAVAALLAITSIPRPKNPVLPTRQGACQKLTVDTIVENAGVSEKTYGISVCKTPLDLLLNNWEEYDETNESENGQESIISTRTFSSDSTPSLVDSIPESASPSSVSTPEFVPTPRRRKMRRVNSYSLSQGSSVESHPLQAPDIDVGELDFRVFQKVADKDDKLRLKDESPRRKSAFKSNLTASLRALKSAARSLSSIKTPLLTPDDFLTRSIISIDPQVPFTDERMPPRLEDIPTPALRRYLNPTTNALIEAHVPPSRSQARRNPECTASIQMQTYKVSKISRNTAHIVISRRIIPTQEDDACTDAGTGPLGRQREMRENSDFIRVAVMEMLMRKRGKLDDQKPGRARWALPPRKLSTRPYQIAPNGVPMRWIPTTM